MSNLKSELYRFINLYFKIILKLINVSFIISIIIFMNEILPLMEFLIVYKNIIFLENIIIINLMMFKQNNTFVIIVDHSN
jgi:hypothetical protein